MSGSTTPPLADARATGRRDLLPAVVLALALLVAALIPVPQVEIVPSWSDLAVHAVLYGMLAVALLWAGERRSWPRPAVTAVVAATGYGVVTELVQALVPHRSATPLDVVADAVGAVIAVALVHAVRRLRQPRVSG